MCTTTKQKQQQQNVQNAIVRQRWIYFCCVLNLCGTWTKVTNDSGATTSILDSAAFSSIQKRNKHVHLESTRTNIYAYNAVQPLPLLAKCHLAVESNSKRVLSNFYVVKGRAGSLLGNKTTAELGILQIYVNEVCRTTDSAIKELTGNRRNSGNGSLVNSRCKTRKAPHLWWRRGKWKYTRTDVKRQKKANWQLVIMF